MERCVAHLHRILSAGLVLLAAPVAGQQVAVKVTDGNQHKATDILVGDRAVKRIGMLAFRWDLSVQQIRKDFENREAVGGGLTKVTWGTHVSEVQLTPALLQAMTDQMYDDLVAELGKQRTVVGIEQIQQVPAYQRVGKAIPALTGADAWAASSWDLGARGSNSLGGLATGIKMTQDDKLGSELQRGCNCDALLFTTIKSTLGQKGKAKVDGVPGIWLEVGSLLDTRVLVGFDQATAAAEALGKRVQKINKMNHVVAFNASDGSLKLFVPGGSAKEMAGVPDEKVVAVFRSHFIEPMLAFSKAYAAGVATAIGERYPRQ